VQRPFDYRDAKDQTTCAIFVIRIIFDNFSGNNCFEQFLKANAPQNALVGCVSGKFKKTGGNLGANLFDHQ